MRRGLGLVLVVSCGLLGAFAACGGSDDNSATSGGDDGGSNDATVNGDDSGNNPGTDSGNPGTDSGNPGTDSGNNGEGGGGDGGGNGDGGRPSDPHKVPCGTVSCDTTTDFCCIHFELDGGVSEAGCTPNNGNCRNGGFEEHCDESADCDGGRICCLNIGGAIGGQSDCQQPQGQGGGGCGIGRIELCRTNAECPNDAGCSVRSCFGGTRQLEVCGKPTGCN
jgi:hypothetical protein